MLCEFNFKFLMAISQKKSIKWYFSKYSAVLEITSFPIQIAKIIKTLIKESNLTQKLSVENYLVNFIVYITMAIINIRFM